MTLDPIGVVESAIGDRKAMPTMGAPGAVRLYPRFADGMLRMEKHSHIWVLGWLDRGERDVLQVTPRGVESRGPESLHGVFAVRSPVRPNPIGLTACRILRIDGLRIEVDRLDFLDGTPVIDVKPYFVTRDSIPGANNAAIGKPGSREALRQSLLSQAEHYHGEICADLALAVRIVEHYRATECALGDPDAWSVTVPLDRPCLIDAIMGMTRATPGKGSLGFADGSAIVLCGHEYFPANPIPTAAEEVLAAPDTALFHLA